MLTGVPKLSSVYLYTSNKLSPKPVLNTSDDWTFRSYYDDGRSDTITMEFGPVIEAQHVAVIRPAFGSLSLWSMALAEVVVHGKYTCFMVLC